ncbi:MAG: hypothetical protein AB7O91_09720 [Sphingomonas sp.]
MFSLLWRLALGVAMLVGASGPAAAAVEIAFHSRELGGSFPHAFIRLTGTIDATGEPVDIAYGFTARAVSPAILFGSVPGEIFVESEARIRTSDRQFRLTLTDAQYGVVMGLVEEWRNREQPSYNLGRANCIHFVAAIASALGLRVELVPRLMRRPRSFLIHQRDLNPGRVTPG